MQLLRAEFQNRDASQFVRALVQSDNGNLGVLVFPVESAHGVEIDPSANWHEAADKLLEEILFPVGEPVSPPADPPALPPAAPEAPTVSETVTPVDGGQP